MKFLKKIRSCVISVLAVLTLGLAMGGVAMAQEELTSPGPSAVTEQQAPSQAGTLFDSIGTTFDRIANNAIGGDFADRVKFIGIEFAGKLNNAALILAGALATTSLMWRVLMAMVTKKSPLDAAVEVMIFGTLTALLIANYATVVNVFAGIASDVLGTLTSGGVGGALREFVTSSFSVIGSIFSNFDTGTGALGFITASIDVIAGFVVAIAVLFLAAKAFVSILSVFMMGPIFFAVGVVFGPLMIATLAADYTRKWFDQWLNFMVGSAFLTVTAVVVLKIMGAVIGASAVGLAGGGTAVAMLGVLILVSSMAKLFEAVPAMTDAIFPGRTGAGAAIDKGTVVAAAITAATLASKSMAGKLMTGTPKAILGALNASTHLKDGIDGAGKAMAAGAKSKGAAIAGFGAEVRNSDAGRSVEGFGRRAIDKSLRAGGHDGINTKLGPSNKEIADQQFLGAGAGKATTPQKPSI